MKKVALLILLSCTLSLTVFSSAVQSFELLAAARVNPPTKVVLAAEALARDMLNDGSESFEIKYAKNGGVWSVLIIINSAEGVGIHSELFQFKANGKPLD